jgi:hypothetical protein
MLKNRYTEEELIKASRKTEEWFDLIKADLFKTFASLAGRPVMANESKRGHTTGWSRSIISIACMKVLVSQKNTSPSWLLASLRLEVSQDKMGGDDTDYQEMQRHARVMLIDKFTQELGGGELMQAVLAENIRHGNFTQRIRNGDFDCKART